MEELSGYATLIVGIAMILMWLLIVAVIFFGWIFSKRATDRFFKVAIKSLMLDSVDKSLISLRNDFELYRNYRYGFSSKTIVLLCQELQAKMKLENNEQYIEKLDEIIAILKDETRFDDEKKNEIVDNVNKVSVKEARLLREYFIRLDAYNLGRLFEKDRNFEDMKVKLTRKKWVSIFGYILGVVGSVASIWSMFF